MFVVAIFFENPRLIEPQSSHIMPVAVNQDAHERTPAAKLPDVAIDHKSVNGLLNIGFQLWHSSHVTEVVDAGRDMKQQIAGGQDSQILQQFSTLRSHTAHELNGSQQPFGRGLLTYIGIGSLSVRHVCWSRPESNRQSLFRTLGVSGAQEDIAWKAT